MLTLITVLTTAHASNCHLAVNKHFGRNIERTTNAFAIAGTFDGSAPQTMSSVIHRVQDVVTIDFLMPFPINEKVTPNHNRSATIVLDDNSQIALPTVSPVASAQMMTLTLIESFVIPNDAIQTLMTAKLVSINISGSLYQFDVKVNDTNILMTPLICVMGTAH